MMKRYFFFFSLATALLGCVDNSSSDPQCPGDPSCICDINFENCDYCGDHVCGDLESCTLCEEDCGVCGECGDGTCNLGQESCVNCPSDCGICGECGDGICYEGETCEECPEDCGLCPTGCGDGFCAADEDCHGCTEDCGECPASCGNGRCDAEENCNLCPEECGACPRDCGDSYCIPEDGENCNSCPQDCGPCYEGDGCEVHPGPGCTDCSCVNCVCALDPTCCLADWDAHCAALCSSACLEGCTDFCGDGVCAGEESCVTCSADCGLCVPQCGDGQCNGDEHCGTCPDDCGACAAEDGCLPHPTPGCTSCNCFEAVCAEDPYCCTGEWDGTCVQRCLATGEVCPDPCGNGLCEPQAGENCRLCPADCAPCDRCGDGICGPFEYPEGCTEDCGEAPANCTDDLCVAGEGENCFSCPDDCSPCAVQDPCAESVLPGVGDAVVQNCVCARDPYCCSVRWDSRCVAMATSFCYVECGGPDCGDGECAGGEDCTLCPVDCGACGLCGDGVCSGGETCLSCPPDCGYCAFCGDGICNVDREENCESCPDDCGPCYQCGNGSCQWALGETNENCPADCLCGDGYCFLEAGENSFICPVDCFCGDGLCEPLAGENTVLCPLDNCPTEL
ncbi:hypothetical protein KKF84_11280 [Myxococcota bacterium]|nr:hypothetical protein [Myxococcota bacterium]MBU1535893.1 hypothetical protein [Myxococcota bacterium]